MIELEVAYATKKVKWISGNEIEIVFNCPKNENAKIVFNLFKTLFDEIVCNSPKNENAKIVFNLFRTISDEIVCNCPKNENAKIVFNTLSD